MRYGLIFLLSVFVMGCQPMLQSRSSATDVITAVGYASISEQRGRTQEEKQLRAMRASKIDAYRELAEQVYGFRISAQAGLDDQQLSIESTDASVDGNIRGAEVIRSYPVGDSYVTEMRLDMKKMERLSDVGDVYHVPNKQTSLF